MDGTSVSGWHGIGQGGYMLLGVVIADSGSPFRQSVLLNVGARDGIVDGWAAMDGIGLVGVMVMLGVLAMFAVVAAHRHRKGLAGPRAHSVAEGREVELQTPVIPRHEDRGGATDQLVVADQAQSHPEAAAIVHPRLPGSDYPFGNKGMGWEKGV